MVRVTPFLPLISSAALLAPTAANRQESYAAAVQHTSHAASLHTKRDLLTCDQTYGLAWIQCGGADSTFCYNPSEGQTCCAQDAGYCDAGTWCAPVAGFCCLEGEDVATCAREVGFALPASSSFDTTVLSTTTLTSSSTTTLSSSTTTSTTLSGSGAVSDVQLPTSCTTVGGLTWTSVYPATITGSVNGSSSTNPTGSAVTSSTFVQISVAQKEHSALMWMTVAMGAVGVFMATC